MSIQRLANSVARKHGHSIATKITFDPTRKKHGVGDCIQCGYRKNTTGEYVPSAYRANFGWKNTYYQHAQCEVILAMHDPAIGD